MNMILWLVGAAAFAQGDPQEVSVRDLFVANCALCHGEKGDGQGTASLERRARSFVDGGFSYGNTPSALRRTIAAGIPGTPMPAWGAAFNEAQIARLADYVIELGPGLPEPPADTELVVKDRPLVVRGMLPPISSGAESHARGLLFGTPDGFSFEYRTDDLRLLGMRQGRFVDRTDWIGRGGTALQPLGPVVFLESGGTPPSTFAQRAGDRVLPLRSQFRGTRVVAEQVWLRSILQDESGADMAIVEECTQALGLDWGSGYVRRWRVQVLDRSLDLVLRGPGNLEQRQRSGPLDWLERERGPGHVQHGWSGADEWIAFSAQRSLRAGQTTEFMTCRLRLAPKATAQGEEQR